MYGQNREKKRFSWRWAVLLVALVAGSLLLAACGDSDPSPTATPEPTPVQATPDKDDDTMMDEDADAMMDEDVDAMMDEDVDAMMDEDVDAMMDEDVDAMMDEDVDAMMDEDADAMMDEDADAMMDEDADAMMSLSDIDETTTSTSTPTPTHTPTATPMPTPTQIPGRPDLYMSVSPPEHMAYICWEWERGRDSSDNWIDEFEELVIDFTIHNNVELEGDNGLYLMLAQSKISDVDFYFGLQTDVHAPEPPYRRGKGLLLSRWETRDLANARFSETDGWTQSSGHEGNFIGVRRSYAWGAGDYRIRFAPDGDPEDDGVWFGLWITDRSTDVATWIGSLKFPLLDGKAVMRAPTYSTMEIYGRRIRPIDIPAWHVSIKRPVGDGIKPSWGHTGYSPFEGDVMNSEVRYDWDNDVVHFKTGGTTERQTQESAVTFR